MGYVLVAQASCRSLDSKNVCELFLQEHSRRAWPSSFEIRKITWPSISLPHRCLGTSFQAHDMWRWHRMKMFLQEHESKLLSLTVTRFCSSRNIQPFDLVFLQEHWTRFA